jgi:spore germination protein GerM
MVTFAAVVLVLAACTRTILTGDDTGGGDRLTVWFAQQNGEELALVPVTRTFTGGDRLKGAVEELLRGPSDEEIARGLGSEIPRGTILLGIGGHGSVIDVNLSRRFASGGGALSLETRVEQLRRTVADAAGARKVYLAVEGERIYTAAGEGLEIKQPLN